METKDNDQWRILFSTMPDEALPAELNVKIMKMIHEKVVFQKKRNRFWELCGFGAGIAVMLITAITAYSHMDVSFKLPEIRLLAWAFLKFNFNIFTSPAFGFNLRIGALALTLLIVDSIIRHIIEKKNKQSSIS